MHSTDDRVSRERISRPSRRSLLKLVGRGVPIIGVSLLLNATSTGMSLPAPARGAPGETNQSHPRWFPIGVFEDGNVVNGDTTRFGAMVRDLKSRKFDTVLFTNNAVDRDEPLLAISDRLGFDVIFAPATELDRSWWPPSVPASLDIAHRVIGPIVDRLKSHSSLKAYSIVDEPGLDLLNKVALATQTFREFDPSRLTMPTLVGTDRVGPIFDAARPDVMLIDVYPVGAKNAIGDFRMTGFGYPNLDFVSYVRAVTHDKPRTTPLWMILQTHQFGNGGPFSLREPTPAEVRAQNWLAIGEGATGIFWFIYSSEQGWIGLKDNPTLYSEVTHLANRVTPLREVLLNTYRTDDRVTVSSKSAAYASTLARDDNSARYIVVVNRNCVESQVLAIDVPGHPGALRDLETSRIYQFDSPISFNPGDGKIFELVALNPVAAVATSTTTARPSPAPDPTPVPHCGQ
jgi:hypothetical protein